MFDLRPEYVTMAIAWLVVAFWIAFVIFTNRKVHPRVLFALFMVELWERFSYYGMRAFLILYLTSTLVKGGFEIPKSEAYGIYGAYGALVYLTPILGGYLADNVLGRRKAIIWGAILMAAGQFTLFNSTSDKILLLTGLSLLVIGNGFFKPNISSLIGKFYVQGDPRRDGAFTIFYMGINIGAFLAPLTCGTVAEIEGWKYGFLLAGLGMVTGLALFLWTAAAGWLEDKADPPEKTPSLNSAAPPDAKTISWLPIAPEYACYLGTFLLVPTTCLLIDKNDIMDLVLGVLGFLSIAYMIAISFRYPNEEQQRIWVIVVLFFFSTVFWSFFELAGSALNIFTEQNVQKTLFGVTLKTSNFQATNALFIMIFAPIFSVMWIQLNKRGIEPAAPVKFALALLGIALGFFVLNLGVPLAENGMMPAIFLVLLYLLHTLGELALSPVGLSLVTKLAPAQIVGFMMGFWFLSSSIGHQAGKWISKATEVEGANATPEQTMEMAMKVFNQVGFFALGSTVVLLILSPLVRKWMHGIR